MLNVNVDFKEPTISDNLYNADFVKSKDVKAVPVTPDVRPIMDQPVLATGVKATVDDVILALQQLNLVTQK